MTISNDLMLAILAMDSYNRDYNQGIILSGNVGTAALRAFELPQRYEAASFFAQAYTWNGQTVISYRGTDVFSTDFSTGYGIGHGFSGGAQGTMAVQFYRTVIGNADPFTANVILTGHSLGGGLAGYVATIFRNQGVLFDPMPFQTAAQEAYLRSITIEGVGIPGVPDVAFRTSVTTHPSASV
jgi:Protein of unknown function (DUF2974)